MACLAFADNIGVCDMCADHRYEIACSFPKSLFGVFEGAVTACDHSRDSKVRQGLANRWQLIANGAIHRPHCRADIGVIAVGSADVIDEIFALQLVKDEIQIGFRHAPGRGTRTYTHAYGDVAGNFGPDRDQYLAQKAHPVLDRSAIQIGPVVCQGREKLMEEIAMGGMDLDAVEHTLPAPGRSVGKRVYHFSNLTRAHCQRRSTRDGAWNGRGRPAGGAIFARRDMAAMIQLMEHPHAMGPNGPHQRLKARNDRIVLIGECDFA
nr:hypothetical protein [Caenibius tardaugens]